MNDRVGRLCGAFCLIVVIASLTCCGIIEPNRNNNSNLLDLYPNMKMEEVKIAMGSPESMTYSSIEGEEGVNKKYSQWEYYLYPKGTSTINFAVGFFTFTFSWWVPNLWNNPDKYYLIFYENNLIGWSNHRGEVDKIIDSIDDE